MCIPKSAEIRMWTSKEGRNDVTKEGFRTLNSSKVRCLLRMLLAPPSRPFNLRIQAMRTPCKAGCWDKRPVTMLRTNSSSWLLLLGSPAINWSSFSSWTSFTECPGSQSMDGWTYWAWKSFMLSLIAWPSLPFQTALMWRCNLSVGILNVFSYMFLHRLV